MSKSINDAQDTVCLNPDSDAQLYNEDELLMLSGLQHIAFCERQWALIHIEKQWVENYHTARGEIFHERAHLTGYSQAKNIHSMRSVKISSYKLGLRGEADIVEYWEDASGTWINNHKSFIVQPVEYKVGKPKVENWDRIQVCAQAMCLEEMLDCQIDIGALFYGKTRRRETVEFNSNLRTQVRNHAAHMHKLFKERKTPKTKKGSRCSRCSLNTVCIPKAFSSKVSTYWINSGLRPS